VHISAVVQAGETLFSDSNNNELLITYLATVRGRRNDIFPPAQSRTVVVCHYGKSPLTRLNKKFDN
jgi:hypothetical protein